MGEKRYQCRQILCSQDQLHTLELNTPILNPAYLVPPLAQEVCKATFFCSDAISQKRVWYERPAAVWEEALPIRIDTEDPNITYASGEDGTVKLKLKRERYIVSLQNRYPEPSS